MTPRTAPGTAILALAAAFALAWANAFAGQFQFDDFASILQDRSLRDVGGFLAELPHRIRPFTRLTYLIDHALFGAKPGGYHLLNLALHAGCGLFVGRLARRLGFGRAGAILTAALFLVMPVTTEAVTYISGRATLLAAFFSLLALVLYDRATPGGPAGPVHRPVFAGALFGFALGLASKETAAVVPLLVLVWDTAGRGARRLGSLARRHAPFWAVAVAAALAGLANTRYRALLAFSLELRPLGVELLLLPRALLQDLLLVVRPDRLNVDHDFRAEAWLSEPWALGGAFLFLGTAAAAACLVRRRAPAVTAGFFLWLLASLPAHVVPRLDLVSERNIYLPLAGLALLWGGAAGALLAAVPPRFGSRARKLAYCAAALAILAGALATRERNRVWADPVALWSDAAAKSPNKARVHANLGQALFQRGDIDGALREYRRAVELEPATTQLRDNLFRAWERRLEERDR